MSQSLLTETFSCSVSYWPVFGPPDVKSYKMDNYESRYRPNLKERVDELFSSEAASLCEFSVQRHCKCVVRSATVTSAIEAAVRTATGITRCRI